MLAVVWGALCVRDLRFGSVPVDFVVNLAPIAESDPALQATAPTLVVLEHGIGRSSWSLWRLERALRAHGYDVLNPGYASTDGRGVRDYAAELATAVEARLREAGEHPPRLAFVGHSMGGLVIRAMLARPDAPRADAVVFLGTPQRGAAQAVALGDRWYYGLLLGAGAARELRPGSSLFAPLGPVRAGAVGVLFGQRGDTEGFSPSIPGDDDGRVGVAEAQLTVAEVQGRLAQRGLAIGHFRLAHDATSIRAVLTFLRDGRLDTG
ncbi:MAG: alpha/beta fold hydrolase [Planctomycetes bacterium]|nr:alpha/beta fold hydrolase [Planctomycetota bacterium]